MRKKENLELRKRLYDAHITFWQLADAVGVHESTIIRWFREPLDKEHLTAVESALDRIFKAREGE